MNAAAIETHPAFLVRHDYVPTAEAARHYNPAVVRHGKELLMAWRIQDNTGLSRVVIAKLNAKTLKPGKPVEIKIEAPARAHIEDPRLIVIRGELLLFVAQVVYGTSFTFVQRGFALGEDHQPVRELALPYGQNGKGKTEKNWMPFELPSGGLGFVYAVGPEWIVIDHESGAMHRTPGPRRWRWGTLSGRTNAVRLPDGRYLTLIGGHEAHARRKSLYWVGAAVFAGEGKHELLLISREPFLWASDRTPAVLNPFDPQWNPLCVFPAGLVYEPGYVPRESDSEEGRPSVLVSLGLNDSFCALMRFAVADLLAGLVPPDSLTGEERVTAPPRLAPLFGDMVRVRVTPKPNGKARILGEHGGPYRTGEEFITTRERAAALGEMVEVLS